MQERGGGCKFQSRSFQKKMRSFLSAHVMTWRALRKNDVTRAKYHATSDAQWPITNLKRLDHAKQVKSSSGAGTHTNMDDSTGTFQDSTSILIDNNETMSESET